MSENNPLGGSGSGSTTSAPKYTATGKQPIDYYQNGSNLILPDGVQPSKPYYDVGTGQMFGIAQYYQGAQNDPYRWTNPDASTNLQYALVAAGYMGKGSVIVGQWNDTAANAYAEALAAANVKGISVEELLNTLAQSNGPSGGGGGGGGLGAAPLTDDDIKALGNKVAQGVLGRNLRDEELAGFIPAFRGAIGGGTSPAAAGENVVRQINPGESYAHDVGNAMQIVAKMLGGVS